MNYIKIHSDCVIFSIANISPLLIKEGIMMEGMNNGWGMGFGWGWGLIVVIAILVVIVGIYMKIRKK